ncbi:MAG: redoxin domain-containing protein [Fibrella sp.]|nr:redoxin domain-containing protein [Armatimonadota bacterium]
MNKQLISMIIGVTVLIGLAGTGTQNQARAIGGQTKMAGAGKAGGVYVAPLPIEKTAPALGTNGTWINGSPTTIAAQKGKVVILTFWTHGCINCKRTLPFWNSWAKQYSGKDVTVLSVHTPELKFERNVENVRRFTRERGLLFPVVTDNDFKSWNAYGVEAWPTTILIDKRGRIRARWEGELDWQGNGEYKKVETAIEQLRKEN